VHPVKGTVDPIETATRVKGRPAGLLEGRRGATGIGRIYDLLTPGQRALGERIWKEKNRSEGTVPKYSWFGPQTQKSRKRGENQNLGQNSRGAASDM